MLTYEPHKFQKLFHKSNARFRTLIAGRRGGKSLAGTVEASWHANKSKCRGWIVAPTYVMLRDINIPMLTEWIPQYAIKDWNRTEKRMELVNGSEIVFRSAEDPDKLRGVGLDWLWLDEACFMKAEVWDVMYPTLTDTKGVAWITTTPQGYDWVYDKFFKPAQEGNADYQAWHYRTVDNPYIDPEIVEKARAEMNDQMFRQEYLATFEKFTGLVYPDFDEKTHVIDPIPADRDDLWFVGIDLGYTNQTAVVLMMEDVDKNMYIVDEIYESGLIAEDVSKRVQNMLKAHGLDIDAIEVFVADPSGASRHQGRPELNMFDQLQLAGLPVVKGNNDVRAGIDRVTQYLRKGKGGLKVFNNCVHTINEFHKYSWKKTIDTTSNRDESPAKAYDHLMDAIRYTIMTRPETWERVERDPWTGEITDEFITEDFESEDSREMDVM